MNRKSTAKKTLRHEIIHAFLNESGLSDSASIPSGAWAKHEEMVDWFAIQTPKIFAVFMQLGLIEVSTTALAVDLNFCSKELTKVLSGVNEKFGESKCRNE